MESYVERMKRQAAAELGEEYELPFLKLKKEEKPTIQPTTQETKALELFSAFELMETELDPVQFVVKDFLPQGLSILCSPPKYGKSWLVLDLCLAVSSGSPFLSKETNEAATLYLALEDSKNRLQSRIYKVLQGEKPSKNFICTTQAETLSGNLISQLEQALKEFPTLKLIVIDTLQCVRGTQGRSEGAYSYDYKELKQLKAFADKNKVALLLVHHLRKMRDDADPFNAISGTNGISGAADTMFVLTRKNRLDKETTLTMTGRDIEQNEILLSFDKDNFKWRVLGNAEEEAERRELEEYKSNPIVRTINHLVANNGLWRGTAAELQTITADYTGKFLETFTSATLSKEIRKLQRRLLEIDNICYTPPPPNGSNGKRLHTFRRKDYTLI
ncbi:MAG: AAA family ATPase [Clostridia bacterium]|nr:AAA family ATPase [Clostridia bacterium]